MVYVYKNTKSTFTGWTIPKDCVQITEEDYIKLYNDELMWQEGELVNNPNYVPVNTRNEEIKKQIAILKSQLAESDYVVIKIAEGVATKEDYIEVLANRALLRTQINDLEGEIE